MTYINRNIQSSVYESFEGPYITALLGPRRVGKSTLVQTYVSKYPSRCWVTFNMDILTQRQRAVKNELKSMIQEQAFCLIGQTKQIWVVIDEAQKCPELFDQIKILYDQFKDQSLGIKFILTGSGSLSLHQLSAETLAGRIEILYLREFSVPEIASLKNNIEVPRLNILELASSEDPTKSHQIKAAIEELSPYKLILEQSLLYYLLWGGLPEVVLTTSEQKSLLYLSNYLQTYLEKDVRAILEITNLNIYQQLIEIIATQTGSIREDQKILSGLGCARETLKKYRGYLTATLVYQEIYPFIGSTLKRLTKSPKGFLLNNGLISLLTGIHNLEILVKNGLIGHRFENWFLQTLNIWLDQYVGQHRIYYWRTSGGIEIDFVVDKKPLVLPFEVTMGTNKDAKKIKHLIQFMSNEKRATQGFYIYNGPYEYDTNLNIHFLPAWSIY